MKPNRKERERFESNPTRVEYRDNFISITIGRKVMPDGHVIPGIRVFERTCSECGETFVTDKMWTTRCWDCAQLRQEAIDSAREQGIDIHNHPALIRLRRKVERIMAICNEQQHEDPDAIAASRSRIVEEYD